MAGNTQPLKSDHISTLALLTNNLLVTLAEINQVFKESVQYDAGGSDVITDANFIGDNEVYDQATYRAVLGAYRVLDKVLDDGTAAMTQAKNALDAFRAALPGKSLFQVLSRFRQRKGRGGRG